MESGLQPGSAPRERLVVKMNATHSASFAAKVPAYAQLQREMHDALLAQHPEWILANGDCPTCDAYDERFAQLLNVSLATERSHSSHTRDLDDRGNFSMSAGYAEPRNIVFPEMVPAM
jgi:hypothetical protein